jgi:dUTP pyrophosphatase
MAISNHHKENGFYELKIYVNNEDLNLFKELERHATEHNNSVTNNPHPDSGFDLPTPQKTCIKTGTSSKINLGIKCVMMRNTYENSTPCPFYIYPRSSTGSKTPLRLANSVGIIDSGYRGNLMAVFDNISNLDYNVDTHQRLVQICTSTLEPFMVSVHTDQSELDSTSRGSGGFGSTGK